MSNLLFMKWNAKNLKKVFLVAGVSNGKESNFNLELIK